MSEISLSPDGSTITVFLPMAWRRRGGRKVIVAPPGCDDWAPPPKIDRALVKALARAHRWQRLLESGAYGTLAELADAERISRSYVSRILRLTLLAPDIVERILDGRPTAGLAAVLEAVPGRVGEAARAVPLRELTTTRTLLWHAKGMSAKVGQAEGRTGQWISNISHPARGCGRDHRAHHHLRRRLVWRRARPGTPAVSCTAACRRIVEKLLS